MNSTETNYTNIKKISISDGHAMTFMDLWKSLLKSQWINNNSCPPELVSQGRLYDRNTVWHPQKGNLSKDKERYKCHSTWLWDCGLIIDEKISKLRNDVKLNEVM